MNEQLNDDIDQLEQEVKQKWEETIESDSERLEGMEQQVMENLSSRNPFNPLSWLVGVKNSIIRFLDTLSPPQRFAVGGGAVVAVLLGLLLGWFISPSMDNGKNQPVIFQLPAQNAKSVNIAGDFSGYKPIKMKDENNDGVWTVRLNLEEGKYEYYYLVNGQKANKYPRADEVVRDWDNSKNGIRFVGHDEEDKRKDGMDAA